MLVAAQNYRNELKSCLVNCWYKDKYIHYFSGEYNEFTVPDNALWRRDFVHLSKEGKVDGYFSYDYNDMDKCIRNIGLISFVDNGGLLVKNVLEHIKTLFMKGAQRLEFSAFIDNPATKIYDRLIKRYGGKVVGELHRTYYYDGIYHDRKIYEILREDYFVAVNRNIGPYILEFKSKHKKDINNIINYIIQDKTLTSSMESMLVPDEDENTSQISLQVTFSVYPKSLINYLEIKNFVNWKFLDDMN
jgi:hypothetical protein